MTSTIGSAPTALDEAALEARLEALERARPWSPRTVSRLEARIRTADDLELFRINPLAYAAATGLTEAEAIDVFLHATKAGLFEMDWLVVCAGCGNTDRSVRSLERVDPHVACRVCQIESDADLDVFIQVAFTVAPGVRRIRYHDPASLEADDLYFRCFFSADVKRREDGRSSVDDLASATRLAAWLEPGERRTLELDVDGLFLAIRDAAHATSAVYFITDEVGTTSTIDATLRDGRFTDARQTLAPAQLEQPAGVFRWPATGHVRGGPVTVSVENAMPERAPIWVVQYPMPTGPLLPVEFEPVLSAKRLLSTQTFRDLFRSERVAIDESLRLRDLTFLFTDLQGSTAMYDRIGDATAYNLVRLHFDALDSAVRENGGAIVKTIGDAVMATFPEPARAVAAALSMLERLDAYNRSASTALGLRVGLHRGAAIAVTLNDQVDYFGQSVNIAARVEGLANAGEVTLSEDVIRDPDVVAALGGRQLERVTGLMKGVSQEIAVYRTRAVPSAD